MSTYCTIVQLCLTRHDLSTQDTDSFERCFTAVQHYLKSNISSTESQVSRFKQQIPGPEINKAWETVAVAHASILTPLLLLKLHQ